MTVRAATRQLVVFDGRIPYGVREVRGSEDPRDSRLVMHGWFEPPAVRGSNDESAGPQPELVVSTADPGVGEDRETGEGTQAELGEVPPGRRAVVFATDGGGTTYRLR